MTSAAPLVVEATPYEYEFSPERAALLVIDMQRDFVEPGGFGEVLGNDVAPLQAIIEPLRLVLAAARSAGIAVIHTREGHQRTSPIARRASCPGDGFLGVSATQVQMAASSSEVNAATTSSTNWRRSPRSP